jgi:hypothetical protein
VFLQRGVPDELPRELPEVQLRLRLVRPRVAGHRGQPVLDELHLQQPGLVQGTSVATCPTIPCLLRVVLWVLLCNMSCAVDVFLWSVLRRILDRD